MDLLSDLKKVLSYDPETGVFTWLKTLNANCKAGDVAGSFDDDGYRKLQFKRKMYRCNRLAWLFVHGALPAGNVDHENGMNHDDRILNLRPATYSQNGQNQKTCHKGNTSGFLGVFWSKSQNKWRSVIRLNGKQIQVGYFDDPKVAHEAYLKKKAILHPYQTIC